MSVLLLPVLVAGSHRLCADRGSLRSSPEYWPLCMLVIGGAGAAVQGIAPLRDRPHGSNVPLLLQHLSPSVAIALVGRRPGHVRAEQAAGNFDQI